MTLYELNQAGYNSLPDFKKQDFENSIEYIETFIYNKSHLGNYWILLNNEAKYYTIFSQKTIAATNKKLVLELLDIVQNLGAVKNIEVNENGAIEFWIVYNGECRVFFFFNYTQGVIEI